eukprot:Skav225766  [mRNA]  locus=scaffold3092:24294:26339:- [translate_table: standard]
MKAITTVAWPRCLHGIAGVTLGKQHFQSLRAAAMNAMKWDVKGASSLVQFSLLENHAADPGFYAFTTVMRQMRTMLDPATTYPILDTLAMDPPQGTVPGPCGVFLQWIHKVGWRWESNGFLLDHEGFLVHLCDSPIQWLTTRMRHAWGRFTGGLMEDREGFQGLSNADHSTTRCGLAGWMGEQLGLLRVCLNGSFFTRDKQHHHDSIPDKQCPWCTSTDSIRHRHWECPFFADIHGEFPSDLREQLDTWPACTRDHGWVLESSHDYHFRTALLSIPDTTEIFQFHPTPGTLLLFTDGSCLHPATPALRLASWGFVQADLEQDTFVPIGGGGVPGQYQTTLRAEIVATIAAVKYAIACNRSVILWVDNQLVVDKMLQFLQETVVSFTNMDKDHDLWTVLSHQVRRAARSNIAITVVKVTSHQDVHRQPSVIEQWVARGNQAADNAAEAARFLLPAEVLRTHLSFVPVHQARQRLQSELFKHFVKIGERAVANKQRASSSTPAVPPSPPVQFDAAVPVLHPFPSCTDLPPEHPASEFAQVVSQWLLGLQNHRDSVPLWVSSYQLYIHFQGTTNNWGMMFQRATNRWVAAEPLFQKEGFQFLRGAAWLQSYIKCLARALGSQCEVRKCLPFGHFLKNWVSCLRIMASPMELAKVDELLRGRDAFAVVSVKKSLGSLGDFRGLLP